MSTMIRTNEEVKAQLEGYKDEFPQAKATSGLIECLMRSHESFKRYKSDQREKAQAEAERADREDIHAGADVKGLFTNFRKQMKLTEAQALEFLISHYHENPTIGPETFGLYRSFK